MIDTKEAKSPKNKDKVQDSQMKSYNVGARSSAVPSTPGVSVSPIANNWHSHWCPDRPIKHPLKDV